MNQYVLIGGAVVAFGVGYWVADQHYEAEVAEIKQSYAETARTAQEKHDAELFKLSAQLSSAVAERDQKIADLERTERARADLSARMLVFAADGNRVPAADSDPCHAVRTELQNCAGLLAEGSRLREEGARLLGKCASNLDAIKKLQP